MAIRLDPRRLSLLKELAGENGMRPGELVTQWIEQRLDAERAGGQGATGTSAAAGTPAMTALSARVDELARRIEELARRSTATDGVPAADGAAATTEEASAPDQATDTPRRRGRAAAAAGEPAATTPRRRRSVTTPAAGSGGRRVPLHEEIATVIAEGGPMSAAEIAHAIVDRGRYSPPRSDRPLDAATVNSRVSNPIYRARFRREDGKIGLSG